MAFNPRRNRPTYHVNTILSRDCNTPYGRSYSSTSTLHSKPTHPFHRSTNIPACGPHTITTLNPSKNVVRKARRRPYLSPSTRDNPNLSMAPSSTRFPTHG